jgi:hypothetical protein
LASLPFVLFVAITDVLSFGARTAVRSFLDIIFDLDERTPTFFAMAKVTRKVPVSVEFLRKGLASNRFSGERFTRWSSEPRIELPFPSRTVEWLIYRSTVHRFESESSVDITADAVPELNRFSPVT